MKWIPILLLFGSVLLGCNNLDAQREFERQALQFPQNITQTNEQGQIIQTDEDDWRIGPLAVGFMSVSVPAYPNPTSFQTVRIEFLVNSINAVRGMILYLRRDNGEFMRIYQHPSGILPVGLIAVTINPELFSLAGSGNGDGIYRLFVYDVRDNLLSYGDIQVQ